tara:strand:- start:454 stop:600 length:147 start_codon:yes stop_codon:yes gene_type:complete
MSLRKEQSEGESLQEATIHQKGLMEMLDLRGGYQSFEHNAPMLRTLAW